MAQTLQAIDSVNPVLAPFTTLWAREAMERAEAADADPSTLGPLCGIPSADKDLVHRAGKPTGFGSFAASSWPVPTASDPMASWLDSTGAISVGKTATSEFGLTGYTETVAYGPTRNPHDLSLGVGGSSGGAAAAVASGLFAFAPGSDGGGSIRIPALACGVAGLKPSRGRVPAQSGLETASGLVVPGILARTVADVSLVSDLLFMGKYHWSVEAPPLRVSLRDASTRDPRPLRIGVTTTTPWADAVACPLDPEAETALEAAIRALREAGHSVEQWEWEPLPGYFEAFSTLWQVSTAGLKLTESDLERVEPLTAWLAEQGRLVSAESLVGWMAWLRGFERDTISQMAGFDAIVTPGLATLPPAIGWYDSHNPEKNFIQQIQVTPYTSFVNVCGLPALALPTHYTSGGVPMGVQIVGPPGREDTVVALGAQVEKGADAIRWPAVRAF